MPPLLPPLSSATSTRAWSSSSLRSPLPPSRADKPRLGGPGPLWSFIPSGSLTCSAGSSDSESPVCTALGRDSVRYLWCPVRHGHLEACGAARIACGHSNATLCPDLACEAADRPDVVPSHSRRLGMRRGDGTADGQPLPPNPPPAGSPARRCPASSRPASRGSRGGHREGAGGRSGGDPGLHRAADGAKAPRGQRGAEPPLASPRMFYIASAGRLRPESLQEIV